jgi:hypothetical protein
MPDIRMLGHGMGKSPRAAAERLPEIGLVTHRPVRSPMGTDGCDWLIDAPIPCPSCGKEAVASLAILKAHDSIGCRYCRTAIDLTDPGTRAFIEEFSSVVASLYSGCGISRPGEPDAS